MTQDQKDLLTKIGQTLYGERWQTDLARDLGHSDGRRIRQWMSGDRPVPKTAWSEFNTLLTTRRDEINLVLPLVQNEADSADRQ